MTLYVFALNTPVSMTLTELTRARGETAGLPPLGDWLGLDALDTDRIELFPVTDLGDLTLSDYLSSAHDADIAGHAARLDALEGSVLLLPEAAMTGTPAPGAEATLIAALPVAQADHRAVLDPATIPPPAPPREIPQTAPSRPLGWVIALALALAILVIWWLT